LFNELVVHLTKRFSDGLQFNVNYEFSRMLETYQLNAENSDCIRIRPRAIFLITSCLQHHELRSARQALSGNANRLLNTRGRLGAQLRLYVESGAVLSWAMSFTWVAT